MTSYILYFILSFSLSLAIIPFLIYLANICGIYDYNNRRKRHDREISPLGGVSLVFGFILTFFFMQYVQMDFTYNILIFIIALIIIYITGFVDNFLNLKPFHKLPVQMIIGLLVCLSGIGISELKMFGMEIKLGMFSHVITIGWVVLALNAVNLVDGLDGLASGLTMIAFIFVFIISIMERNYLSASLSVMMVGSISGFYIFNFPKAKIFMGNGGSYFLGFMYSTITLMKLGNTATLSDILFPLFLFFIPIFDIFNVIIRRYKAGYPIMSADRNHLHYRLVNMGFSVKKILFIMYLCSILLGIIAIIIHNISELYSLGLFILIVFIFIISMYILNTMEKDQEI